jgi:hypothetical protein
MTAGRRRPGLRGTAPGWPSRAHGPRRNGPPDTGAALPPTPHPLAELFGLLTTPLGQGSVDLTMVIAYAALGLIGYLVYRLGSLWFDRPIGALAALIVLTRAPYLSNGLRAYIDLPYIALVLGALVIETKRPRAGWPVLAPRALAGLLRPEAWLFSVAYFLHLALELRPTGLKRHSEWRLRPVGGGSGWVRRRGERSAAELAGLGLLALAGPIGWGVFDWITAGSPTYSFTGTRDTVETLDRRTGPVDLVLYGPRALGEVMQWPGMVGAFGGVVLAIAFLRRRAAIGLVAGALALVAFGLLAASGLAIIARYTMLAAAILAIFAALALLGWRLLERDHPWRRAWQAFAAVVLLMALIWVPNQYDLLHDVDRDLTNQGVIEGDLHDLAKSGAFAPICGPITVPNHRAVPRLAFDLDIRPSTIVSFSEQRHPRRGDFLEPANDFVIHNFVLDPNDQSDLRTPVPAGFRRVASNESWLLYRRC